LREHGADDKIHQVIETTTPSPLSASTKETFLPTEKKEPKGEPIKVTDKRIFTPEGEIRDEYRDSVKPAAPGAAPPPPPPQEEPKREEKRRRVGEKVENPNTPFGNLVQSLVLQAYMSLGLLRDPYHPEPAPPDLAAARQLIDMVTMLKEKTEGNLTPEESDFLEAHIGELKLAFVQRGKTL
jgi:hypothetical protein